MPVVKISDLPAAGVLTGDELLPVVQDGDTVRTTAQGIADLAGGGTFTAQAAVSVTGGTGDIRAATANVASVVRNGVGDYTVNLTSGFVEGVSVPVISTGNAIQQTVGAQMDGNNVVQVNAYSASDGSPADTDFYLIVLATA